MITRRQFIHAGLTAATLTFLEGCIPRLPEIKDLEATSGYLTLDDGTNIYYEERPGDPQLPTLVYSHGLGRDHDDSALVFSAFPEYRTISWDLPSHGRSDAYRTGRISVPRLARTLDRILTATNTHDSIDIGNSTGTIITIQYLTEKPKGVRGAVLLSGLDRTPCLDLFSNPFVDIYLDLKRRRPSEVSHPIDYEGYLEAFKEFDVRDRIRDIEVPVVVMTGKQDRLMLFEEVNDMVSRFTAPHLYIVFDSAHDLILHRTVEINEALRDALDTIFSY